MVVVVVVNMVDFCMASRCCARKGGVGVSAQLWWGVNVDSAVSFVRVVSRQLFFSRLFSPLSDTLLVSSVGVDGIG